MLLLCSPGGDPTPVTRAIAARATGTTLPTAQGLHVLICKMGTRHLPHRDVKWENPGRCLGLSRDPIMSAPTPPTPKFLPLCGPSPGLRGSYAVWELELPALSSNPMMLFSSCVTLGKDHRRPQIWRVPKNMKLTPHPRLIQ